jgi:hypothetical protein
MSHIPCPRCGATMGCKCVPWAPRPVDIKRLEEEAQRIRDRRERIATACMAGLLADPNVDADAYEISCIAVRFADALIARLDAEVKP